MAYNRPFSRAEVDRILGESEGRTRPDLQGQPNDPDGHALRFHTSERKDIFRRDNQESPKTDSMFLMPREDMAEFVHEAINSVPGQRKLVKLNHSDTKSIVIESILIRKTANFDILTVYRPEGQQSEFDWLSTTTGDGFIFQLFVLVYKIPNSPTEDIHIQTAFPNRLARLQGEEIVFPTLGKNRGNNDS